MVAGHHGHQGDVDLLPGLRAGDDDDGTGLGVVTSSVMPNTDWSLCSDCEAQCYLTKSDSPWLAGCSLCQL